MTVPTTLCYLRKDGKVLLQLKHPDLFGGGKWNGPGGKIHPGENPKQSAIREVFEETGLKAKGLKEHGILEFYSGNQEMEGARGAFSPRKVPDIRVHVFSARDFSGRLRHSKEGPLEWIPESKIPYESMWEDDRIWMPLMLEGKKFRGRFWFGRDFKGLVRHKLEEIRFTAPSHKS